MLHAWRTRRCLQAYRLSDLIASPRDALATLTFGESGAPPSHIRPQIEYNTPAIAGLGLASLYLKDGDTSARDPLLRLASNQHPAVMNALGRDMVGFARFDARQPRSHQGRRQSQRLGPPADRGLRRRGPSGPAAGLVA